MGFTLFPGQMRQWKVVLIAFLAATTFWFLNSLNKEYTTSLDYPVEFVFDQDSLTAVRPLPERIGLDVTGGGWSLLRKSSVFNPAPIVIELDNPVNTSLISWIEFLPLIREQVNDLNVNQVLQDTLNLHIEPVVRKKCRVMIDSLSVLLSPSFRITSPIRISPDSVEFIGPKSQIDRLGDDYSLNLGEDEIDDNYESTVEIRLAGEKSILAKPDEVDISFDVAEFVQQQLEVPIRPVNFPEDSMISHKC